MSEYFPKQNAVGEKVKVELDLSNYATKTDLENAKGVDTLDFLKSEVDKLDIDYQLVSTVGKVK